MKSGVSRHRSGVIHRKFPSEICPVKKFQIEFRINKSTRQHLGLQWQSTAATSRFPRTLGDP